MSSLRAHWNMQRIIALRKGRLFSIVFWLYILNKFDHLKSAAKSCPHRDRPSWAGVWKRWRKSFPRVVRRSTKRFSSRLFLFVFVYIFVNKKQKQTNNSGSSRKKRTTVSAASSASLVAVSTSVATAATTSSKRQASTRQPASSDDDESVIGDNESGDDDDDNSLAYHYALLFTGRNGRTYFKVGVSKWYRY